MYRKFIRTFNNFYRFTEIYRPKNREIIDFFSFTEIGKNWKLWNARPKYELLGRFQRSKIIIRKALI
jgi:hypothetical protein